MIISHFRARTLRIAGASRVLFIAADKGLVATYPYVGKDVLSALTKMVPHGNVAKLALNVNDFASAERVVDAMPRTTTTGKVRRIFPRATYVPWKRFEQVRIKPWNPLMLPPWWEGVLQARSFYVQFKVASGGFKSDAQSGTYVHHMYRLISDRRSVAACLQPLLRERFVDLPAEAGAKPRPKAPLWTCQGTTSAVRTQSARGPQTTRVKER